MHGIGWSISCLSVKTPVGGKVARWFFVSLEYINAIASQTRVMRNL